MQRIKKLYRSEYTGEDMVTDLTWERGEWKQTKEFIDSAVTNNQTSNRAVVIGNGESRVDFDLGLIQNHRGGLFGSTTLQSYGCNALYRDFEATFSVATGPDMIAELKDSGYCDNHIVYANAQFIAKNPGKFYLIPQDPAFNAGSIATYLACFDGHKQVYLLGFDFTHDGNANNNVYAGTNAYTPADTVTSDAIWIKAMSQIMETYADVDFVRVCATKEFRGPEALKYLPNYRQISYREFVLEADL